MSRHMLCHLTDLTETYFVWLSSNLLHLNLLMNLLDNWKSSPWPLLRSGQNLQRKACSVQRTNLIFGKKYRNTVFDKFLNYQSRPWNRTCFSLRFLVSTRYWSTQGLSEFEHMIIIGLPCVWQPSWNYLLWIDMHFSKQLWVWLDNVTPEFMLRHKKINHSRGFLIIQFFVYCPPYWQPSWISRWLTGGAHLQGVLSCSLTQKT